MFRWLFLFLVTFLVPCKKTTRKHIMQIPMFTTSLPLEQNLLSKIKQTNQNTTSQYKNNQISLVASKTLQTIGYKCWFEPKMITSTIYCLQFLFLFVVMRNEVKNCLINFSFFPRSTFHL